MGERDDEQTLERAVLEYATPVRRVRRSDPLSFIIGVLLVIGMFGGIIATVAFVTIESMSHSNPAREGGLRGKCASNLRMMGGAITAYATDHGGKYPGKLSELLPYLADTETFVCPSSNEEKATGPTTQAVAAAIETNGHHSYVYVGSGLMAGKVAADRVIAYEPLENHDQAGVNVLYGDGHVDWLDQAEAKRILSELAAGFNPPRAMAK